MKHPQNYPFDGYNIEDSGEQNKCVNILQWKVALKNITYGMT